MNVLILILIGLCVFSTNALIDGVVYIVGPGKSHTTAALLSNLKENVYSIARLFKSYYVFISVEEISSSGFSSWSSDDSRVNVIKDEFSHPSKTVRLAHQRNLLLDSVRYSSKFNSSLNDYLVVMDFDEVNSQSFSQAIISAALSLTREWDAVSFNRLF